jgi:type IV secretion system protein VirD4
MARSPFAGGLIRRAALSMLAKEDKERSSIISTATTQTSFLDAPQIIASLRHRSDRPRLDMAALLGDPVSIFLCLPAPLMPAFNRWLRLVVSSALTEMTMRLAPPEKRVLFLLDELATLGHLESVENAVGLAAGYGLQVWAVFQDIPQMKDTYKARWASFVGNSGVFAAFAVNDVETAKYVSDMMGVGTVESRSESRDRLGRTSSASAGTTSRALQTPDEVLRQDRRQMYVLLDGQRPVVVERVNYDETRALAGLWGATPQPWKEPQPLPSVVDGAAIATPMPPARTPAITLDPETGTRVPTDEEVAALFAGIGKGKKGGKGDGSRRP